MPNSSRLQRFVEDELSRSTAMAERTVQGTTAQLQQPRAGMLGASERQHYHDLLQRFIDHDHEIEFRQSEIATIKFPLKLAEVVQVDSKTSPAVQLADVMIGAAIEAGNNLAGLRSGGPDPEAVLSLYSDDQFIHMIPSIDFEEQQRFRQGTQAADVIDYFSANFFVPRKG